MLNWVRAWDGTNEKQWYDHLLHVDDTPPAGTVLIAVTPEDRARFSFTQMRGPGEFRAFKTREFHEIPGYLSRMRGYGWLENYPDLSHFSRRFEHRSFCFREAREMLVACESAAEKTLFDPLRPPRRTRCLEDLSDKLGNAIPTREQFRVWNTRSTLEEGQPVFTGTIFFKDPKQYHDDVAPENWDADVGIVLPEEKVWWYSESLPFPADISVLEAQHVARALQSFVHYRHRG